MSTVYCISGLGADHRLFTNLNLPGHQVKPLHWVSATGCADIADYAQRLIPQVTNSEELVFLGVSFGGLVAQELALIIKPTLTIIVSSVKNRLEIPWYFRLVGHLRLHRLMAGKAISCAPSLLGYFQGISNPAEKKLFSDILKDTDLPFARWCVDQLLNWPGCSEAGDVFHVHGSADRMLPIKYVRPDVTIDGGTHLMILNRADELSRLFLGLLAEISDS